MKELFDKYFAQAEDLLWPIFMIFGGVAYSGPLKVMKRLAAANARLAGERLHRYWQHEVGVHMRSLLWYALVINVAVMGAVYYYLTVDLHPAGDHWFRPWLVGIVGSSLVLGYFIIRLWRVKGYTDVDRETLYDTKLVGDGDEKAEEAAKQARDAELLAAYTKQVEEIERRVGPPSQRNVQAFLAIASAFILNSGCLLYMAAKLYRLDGAPFEEAYVPVFAGLALLGLYLVTLATAALVLNTALESLGGFSAPILRILIRMVLISSPVITSENIEKWIGDADPFAAAKKSLRNAGLSIRPWVGGAFLILALYLTLLDLLVTLILIPVSLFILKCLEIFLSWTCNEETSRKWLARVFKFVVVLLPTVRLLAILAHRYLGWDTHNVSQSKDRTMRFVAVALNGGHLHALWIIPVTAIAAALLFYAGSKVPFKVGKVVVFAIGALFASMCLLTLFGGIWKNYTGQETVEPDVYGLRDDRSDVSPRASTLGQVRPQQTVPAPQYEPPLVTYSPIVVYTVRPQPQPRTAGRHRNARRSRDVASANGNPCRTADMRAHFPDLCHP